MDRVLSAEQKEKLKQALENKRAVLGSTERRLENEGLVPSTETGEVSSARLHPADRGTEESDRTLTLRLAESELGHLQEIDAALERIQTEKYGECEECGDDIPLKRLEAIPETRLCVSCEAELEEDAKNRSRPADATKFGSII